MKILYKLFIVLFSLLFVFSCSKEWLDVNDNPNATKTATPELLFPSGVISLASNVGGYYNLIGGFWSQYWSQSNSANQYKSIDQYQIQAGSFNGQWREMYAGALNELNITITEAKKTENNFYVMAATLMQVYGFQVMVDFYDDVPYFNAFKGESDKDFNPAFDKGEKIYDDLILRIDEVLALEVNELTKEQKAADFIFEGDRAKWVEFANTLKLKIYLRQMYARESVAQVGIEALKANGSTFITYDAAVTQYEDQENKDNPLYASNIRKLNVGTNLRVSTTIFKYFEDNSDPRLDHIADGSKPMPQGGFNISSKVLDPKEVAVFKQSATDPVYFISEVESYLLQAEAVAKGWLAGDDKALYDAAVTAAFARYGEDASSFIASGGAYEYPSAGAFDDKQQAIMMAKWAAFAGSQSLEMFFERNRTGYPKESTEPAWKDNDYNYAYVGGEFTYSMEGVTGGKFPKRMIYPQDEVNLNTSFPGQTVLTDKVWWDKK